MGFVQVVKHLPQILGGMRRCRADIAAYRPDVLILVDYPGFNLGMAKWVKKHLPQIKTVYYISPKIWAWKEWRIRDIKSSVDCMLSILPFEVDFYRRHQYPITYVGNPTVDELSVLASQPLDRVALCRRYGLDPERPIVALLAGSRRAEVTGNLPIMLRTLAQFPDVQAVIAGAPGLTPEFYAPLLQGSSARLLFDATYDLLRLSQAALVTSGTATLETAYLNVPQVVCYQFKGGMLVYKVMERALRSIHYVSLVNLLVNEGIVTELLGPYLTLPRLTEALRPLLTDTPQRRQMLADYDRMRAVLGAPGAPQRAAARIMQLCAHPTA
jgi:lipid-A-disaccharide synthase